MLRSEKNRRAVRFPSMDTKCTEYTWLDGRTYQLTESDISRFEGKIVKYEGSCWEWTGYRIDQGYGQMWAGGKSGRSMRVHRLAYTLWVGPISAGLELDHICHGLDRGCAGGRSCAHRRCVNPGHLEPVTGKVNVLRSSSFVAANAAKTHCYKGHPFSAENTYRYPDGRRQCRICMYEHNENRRSGRPLPPSTYDRRTSGPKQANQPSN